MESEDSQLGFLFADFDGLNAKDAQVSMEHPFFSLSKKPDRAIRMYEHNGRTITITPSVAGMPTIWDKEVLIFCCSQLVKAIDMGEVPSRTIRTTAYRLLKETHRSIGINGYNLLEGALQRLRGVTIKTNIQTANERTREGFGLIEEWRIVEKKEPNPRMISIEIVLSNWLYRAVVSKEILTLNKDYFKLKSSLERRIYELCRKHCGTQQKWEIGLDLLHKKSGSKATLKTFKFTLGKIAQRNSLPDYRVLFRNNKLTVYYSPAGGDIQQIVDIGEILDGLSNQVSEFSEEDY